MTNEELNRKLHKDKFDLCVKKDVKGKRYDLDKFCDIIPNILAANLSTNKENRELKMVLRIAKIEMKIQDLQNELKSRNAWTQ